MFTDSEDSVAGELLIVGLPEIAFGFLRSLLPTNLPPFSRLLQLPIPLGMELLLTPGEHVLRRNVARGAVQSEVVVILDVTLHHPPRILQRQRRSRPDALSF